MVKAFAGRITPVEIEEEMQKSYLDYAMSVIVGRALPDVRDGLKPVHRRILYGMYEQGLQPNKPHRKSARVVGDVMGKYHPHGDAAIYDALVRMAQDFSIRYDLIDGHGNFGSVDGDSPAAMRYTEARLSEMATELLRDIEKETVNFVPNYDESLNEPSVLPARFPNLLVNGSSGIAVGMATNIPPHNMGEVIDATVAAIDNPEISIRELMGTVKGPDFPTGGMIIGWEGCREAYTTGRGIIRMRGRAVIEETKSGRHRIVITELPYQVNKARLAERIAELVREKKITDITDLRDESDRAGMRLVIELKREAVPKVVVNQLYKYTQLQESFGAIMIALVNGVPRTLNLKEMIEEYIKHQVEVVERRTRFELDRAEKRAHILEGLIIALDNLDAAIKLIRSSANAEIARNGLMEKFGLSQVQAQAILDMRLHRLTGLEREKIREEHAELQGEIAYLMSVLADPWKLRGLIKDELTELKRKFSDPRRTEIRPGEEDLDMESLIADEDVIVSISHSGYVKRLPIITYRMQHRGGRGVMGMNLKENDFVEHLFIGSTHQYIHFFSNRGKVYRLKVYELPEGSRTSRGQALVNVLALAEGERIQAIVTAKEYEDQYLVMCTRRGRVKKTRFREYNSTRRDGIIAINLTEGDEVIEVKLTHGGSDLILVTEKAQAIRFSEDDCRPLGRVSQGVKGIDLAKGDGVLSMAAVSDDADLFVITENGYGKRTAVTKYPRHHRGGKGVKTLQGTEAKGDLRGAMVVRENQELLIMSSEGIMIRVPVAGIPRYGRLAQGVKVMNLGEGDAVAAVARVVAEEDQPEPEE